MRYLLLLLLLPGLAFGATVGPDEPIGWEFPVEEEPYIDGFKLYNYEVHIATIPYDVRQVILADVGVNERKSYRLCLTAYNAVEESSCSNDLPFVLIVSSPDGPGIVAPSGLKFVPGVP